MKFWRIPFSYHHTESPNPGQGKIVITRQTVMTCIVSLYRIYIVPLINKRQYWGDVFLAPTVAVYIQKLSQNTVREAVRCIFSWSFHIEDNSIEKWYQYSKRRVSPKNIFKFASEIEIMFTSCMSNPENWNVSKNSKKI